MLMLIIVISKTNSKYLTGYLDGAIRSLIFDNG